MTVHQVMAEVMERGWLSAEERGLYWTEFGLALLGDAAGYPLVVGPHEVFAEVCEKAGLRGNVRSYYVRQFGMALDEHIRELQREVAA